MIILVIDDHPLYRDALARLLPQVFADATVMQAADYTRALSHLTDAPQCEMALLDLDMPGTHGRTALAQLRRDYPTLKVVVVSASENPAEAQRCIQAGASGFIPKSARTEVLSAALRLIRDAWPEVSDELFGGTSTEGGI